MAATDHSIRDYVQGQYAVLLLDHVAEFKIDFIRIILEDALLGMKLEAPSPFQKRLAEYFTNLITNTELIGTFENWREALGTSLKNKNVQKPIFIGNREKLLLEALPKLVSECIERFESYWHDHDEFKSNEDKARTLAKGFVHGEWFRKQVVPPIGGVPSGINDARDAPSLGWLFQSVLFLTTPSASEHPGNGNSNGKLHVVLPQLLGNGEARGEKHSEIERCFPVTGRSSFEQNSELTEELLAILNPDSELTTDCPPIFSIGTIDNPGKIGVLTGLTTLFYDTSLSTGSCDFADKFAKLSYLFGNCNCIQFLPRPDKIAYGFFQLQSCVPGLVEAIWPARIGSKHNSPEFPPSSRYIEIANKEVIIELPAMWPEWWDKLVDVERNKPAQILNRIRHYHNAWPDKLWVGFERLRSLSVATAVHVEELAKEKERARQQEEITELEKRYRRVLAQIQQPLQTIVESLIGAQASVQHVNATLFSPQISLFSVASVVAKYFNQNDWVSFGQVNWQSAHSETSIDTEQARQAISSIVLHALGVKEKGISTRKKLYEKVVEELAGDSQMDDQRSELRRVIKCLMGIPANDKKELENLFFGVINPLSLVKLKAIFLRLKQVVFTPFKPDSFQWPALPIVLIASEMNVPTCIIKVCASGEHVVGSIDELINLENRLTTLLGTRYDDLLYAFVGIPPAFPIVVFSHFLDFLRDVLGHDDARPVESLNISIDRSICESCIEIIFSDNCIYLENKAKLGGVLTSMETIINNSLGAGLRGDFMRPYLNFAERCVGKDIHAEKDELSLTVKSSEIQNGRKGGQLKLKFDNSSLRIEMSLVK